MQYYVIISLLIIVHCIVVSIGGIVTINYLS